MLTAAKYFTLTVFAPLVLVFAFAFALVIPPKAQAQDIEFTTAHLSVMVRADGVNYAELYHFVTDLHNDSLWYPGVAFTEQTRAADNPPNKRGIEYDQVTFFNGMELRTHAVVTGDSAPHFFHLEGSGPFASFNSYYVFHPAPLGSGTFTLTTSFVALGITEELLRSDLTLAMNNILDHFNTTGEVTIRYINILP